MPDATFKHNGATVTVRAKRGSDVLDTPLIAGSIVRRISEEHDYDVNEFPVMIWRRIEWFVGMLLRSTIDGDLGFPWVDSTVFDDDEVYDCYNALMESDGQLVTLWRKASQESDLEITSPEE
jgi:hypothetical protein